MKKHFPKVVLAIAMFGAVLAGESPALAGGRTVTIRTTSLVPDLDGYLYCVVHATSTTPIGVLATIMAADGSNVTEFGTGFRAGPAVTGDGTYYAEETAGSFGDGARYCQVTVSGARRKDVQVSLQAIGASGALVAAVEAR